MTLEPLLVLFVLGLAILLHARERDILLLRRALLALTKGEPCAHGLHFSSREATRLWQSIQGILRNQELRAERTPSLSKVLRLGNEIVLIESEEREAASRACRLFLRETYPEVTSVSLIIPGMDSESNLFCSEGIIAERIQRPILAHIQNRRDAETQGDVLPRDFEHIAPRRGELLDFTLLGIGTSAFLYLRKDGELFGAFWIGFSSTTSQLSSERLALLHGLAQHCANCFQISKYFREKLSKSSRERNWLIGLSHDLRSPGATALYALQDLLTAPSAHLNDEQRFRLHMIECSIRAQMDLVNDMLDLAKEREGLLEARRENFSLRDAVTPILHASQLEAHRKNLCFTVSVLPEVHCIFDIQHFKRILRNLLSNAIKYTERGGIEVLFQRRDDLLKISIIDSGIGVPRAERAKLFRKFTRLPNASSHAGFGLGLTIAKTLAEINSGDLQYQENEFGGCCFSLLLPLQRFQESLGSREKLIARTNLTVLLVDDDELTLKTYCRFFRRAGVNLLLASSCHEALEKAKKSSPDIVLSDLHLEEESSEPLFEFLYSQMPHVERFLVTGSGDSAQLRDLKEKYRLKILEKPLERRQIESLFFSGPSLMTSGQLDCEFGSKSPKNTEKDQRLP